MSTSETRWQTPAVLRVRALTALAFMRLKSPAPLTSGPAIDACAACLWHTLMRRA